jgi:hypothetical protein
VGSKRRSSHIFREWSLLEDSRYTSQVNSTGSWGGVMFSLENKDFLML